MASKPVMIEPRAARLAFWRDFQQEVERHVRECNATAGQHLWVTSTADEPSRRFSVTSKTWPADRVDCSFDVDKGILACMPGPALKAKPVRFEWVGDGSNLLRGHGRDLTLEDALQIVLGRLVWVDEE